LESILPRLNANPPHLELEITYAVTTLSVMDTSTSTYRRLRCRISRFPSLALHLQRWSWRFQPHFIRSPCSLQPHPPGPQPAASRERIQWRSKYSIAATYSSFDGAMQHSICEPRLTMLDVAASRRRYHRCSHYIACDGYLCFGRTVLHILRKAYAFDLPSCISNA
jgi:hypothetical protein